MKCLIRMYAEEDKGVIFYETVISLKWQKHTCIECVPLPWAQYEDIPGYFKVTVFALPTSQLFDQFRRNQSWLQKQNGPNTKS